jgi:hypothetical protein
MLIVQIPLCNHRRYLSTGIEPATDVLFVYHRTPGKPRGGVPSGASSNTYSNHLHAKKVPGLFKRQLFVRGLRRKPRPRTPPTNN